MLALQEQLSVQPSILVADDNEDLRSLIQRVLVHCGYSVVEARDGAEALRMLRMKRFDLLVTDYEMPNLTGTQLIEKIRKDKDPFLRTVRIIMLTANTDQKTRNAAQEAGADGFLEKPFQLGNLREIVTKLLLPQTA